MKYFLLILLWISMVLPVLAQTDSTAVVQRHQQAEAQFDVLVSKFARFFKTPQQMFYLAENPQKKQGIVAYVIEVNCKKLDYGVVSSGKEDGATHEGHIVMTVARVSNRSCGDVAGANMFALPKGFSTIAAALQQTKKSCFKKGNVRPAASVRLRFQYEDGQWRFVDANLDGKVEAAREFALVFGKVHKPAIAIEDAAALQFNQPWRNLLLP